MKVCALKFTEKVRERTTAVKGKCITFAQLGINKPKGENIILLWGTRDREAIKHFGKVQVLWDSNSKPYINSKERKLERVGGRRFQVGINLNK